jgi:hypothetical protein
VYHFTFSDDGAVLKSHLLRESFGYSAIDRPQAGKSDAGNVPRALAPSYASAASRRTISSGDKSGRSSASRENPS